MKCQRLLFKNFFFFFSPELEKAIKCLSMNCDLFLISWRVKQRGTHFYGWIEPGPELWRLEPTSWAHANCQARESPTSAEAWDFFGYFPLISVFRPTDGSARNLSYHLMQWRHSNPRQRVAPDWDLSRTLQHRSSSRLRSNTQRCLKHKVLSSTFF